jgi:electron transfer flavoprotein alpha subunit
MSASKRGNREIWVFVEQRFGILREVGLELLGKARELAEPAGGRVTAVLLGDRIEGLAEELHAHGADRVLLAESPHLDPYRLMPYASALDRACRRYDPDIFLFGATAMGVELAPRLAARLGTGLSAHCIDLGMDEDGILLQMVPGWGGGVVATIRCPEHRPQMASVMPGVLKKRRFDGGKGELVRLEMGDDLDLSGPRVIGLQPEEAKGVCLEGAEIVVAGGWGIGGREGWARLEELAGTLGAAVGATRPPADEGWAREEQMIGQSGKTVRPRLYLGIGISGMMHHLVGMDESECVISINQDPNAPIFACSDLAVVADYREILGPLMAEIRKRRQRE